MSVRPAVVKVTSITRRSSGRRVLVIKPRRSRLSRTVTMFEPLRSSLSATSACDIAPRCSSASRTPNCPEVRPAAVICRPISFAIVSAARISLM